MTSGSSILRNAVVYLSANVLNAAIPFFLLPVLTRVLTPADYGTVAMFASVLTVLGALTGLSVHGAVGVRYFQLDKPTLAEYVACCVGIVLCSGAVIIAVVAWLRSWLADVTGVPSGWLLIAVVASCLQVLAAMRLSLWQAAGKAGVYAGFQVAQSLTNVGLSLVLVLGAGWAWEGRVFGQTVAVGAFGLLGLALLASDRLVRLSANWRSQSADALRFGLPLVPHALGSLAIATGGQFLVTNMFGVAETGLYVVCAQLGAAMGLVSDAFVKTYSPWLYKRLADPSTAGRSFIVGVSYCLFVGFLLVSAMVSALVFWLFPLIVGQEFRSARALAMYFVFANGFVGMYYAVAGFFFFSSKTHFVSIVTIVSGGGAIAIMWLLGDAFGIAGVAGGYLVANAATFVLAWILSNKVCPLPWLQVRASFAALSRTKLADV